MTGNAIQTGKVIQGLFLSGRAQIQAQAPSSTPHRPGLLSAFSGRAAIVQGHGAHEAFAVDSRQLGLMSGGGSPLPDAVRSKMESALGADFRSVRVHVGPQAARIGALAFTLGSEIYFAPGRYQPDTLQGQQVLGHELAHVLQQRAGRVRNPLGSGMAVVQDRALEAEADRLGQHAAAYRMPLQPKLAQASAPVRISPPLSAGPNSYANAAGRPIGSVIVHARDGGAAEVTDLGVDAAHRDHGVGKMLLTSAARTAQQLGRTKVTLAAQDNGSGHLVRWYQQMGFAQTGAKRDGYPELAAPIGRLTVASLQGLRAAPSGVRSFSLQLMEKKKAADKERRKKQEADRAAQSQKAKAKNYEKEPSKDPTKKKANAEQKINLEKKNKEEQARRQKEKEELELAQATRLADASRDFRRKETLARFLETDKNICVAVVEIGNTFFATTNQGKLGKLYYQDETLYLDPGLSLEKGEPPINVSATKLSAHIADKVLAEKINGIKHVRTDDSDKVHAEMKMLDFLVSDQGISSGTVTIYISRLLCAHCSRAITLWNQHKQPKVTARTESHGGSYPGWEPPACMSNLYQELEEKSTTKDKAEKDSPEKEPEEKERSRSKERIYILDTTTLSQRRSRSKSPARDAKFDYL